MILLNYGGFVWWVCLSGTTIDVRIWGKNYLFLSDFRMARGHFSPKQSFNGNWKLLTGVLQTGTRQLACISRVCVRLCCMSMKLNWQIMARERQLAQLALQRLYRMPHDNRFMGLIIPPASTKLKGGILVSRRLSVCPPWITRTDIDPETSCGCQLMMVVGIVILCWITMVVGSCSFNASHRRSTGL